MKEYEIRKIGKIHRLYHVDTITADRVILRGGAYCFQIRSDSGWITTHYFPVEKLSVKLILK
jgi:hypothetical protein